MPLRFFATDGAGGLLEIPGSSGSVVYGSSMSPGIRRYHYGTVGESEIRGFRGGRPLTCDHWLYAYGIRTYAQAIEKVNEIDSFVNHHGKLEELDNRGAVINVFDNTTFKSWSPEGKMAPMKDVGGCLLGGYWLSMTFRFYQLLTIKI